jgi:YD repeat-containing protein
VPPGGPARTGHAARLRRGVALRGAGPRQQGDGLGRRQPAERGNLIEAAYFDTDGKPTFHKDGNHKSTSAYDERGNQVEQAFFGLEGQPVAGAGGYHKKTAKYDLRGNQTEEACFDAGGRPTPHKDGHARVAWSYDDRDRVVKTAYYDRHGGLIKKSHPAE